MPKRKKQPTGNYPVGFCRPPVSSRWLPGQSGNPKGRVPAGSLDALEALVRALKHKVSRRVDTSNMTAMEGVMYKLVGEALKGNPSGMRHLFNLLNFAEAVDQREVVIEAKLVFEEEENRLMKLSEENREQQEQIQSLKAQLAALSASKAGISGSAPTSPSP